MSPETPKTSTEPRKELPSAEAVRAWMQESIEKRGDRWTRLLKGLLDGTLDEDFVTQQALGDIRGLQRLKSTAEKLERNQDLSPDEAETLDRILS